MKRFLWLLLFLLTPIAAHAQFVGTKPCATLTETDQTSPLGRWRFCVDGDRLLIEKNTATNGGFGTIVQYMACTSGACAMLGADVSSNTATSVDSEIALFSGTTGKVVKRATGSGLGLVTSGVLSTVAAPAGTVVGTSDMQTLTTKTINGANNTLTVRDVDLAFTDITTNNVTASAHGLMTKLSGNATDCYKGNGTYSACGGVTQTRYIQNVSQTVISNTGAPVTVQVGTSGVVYQMPDTADSSVVTWFTVPPDASGSNDVILELDAAANAAPGATNNKVAIKVACTKNGTASAYTALDTFTLTNDTLRGRFTGTNAKCTAVAAGDRLSVAIYRDRSVANNAATGFNVFTTQFRYTSIQ